ncbi:complement C1q-like protein 3 [Mytilus californianus]|uniref:complement C1q-like protein 3 n=1 Tax=Mytilus californianus TaxID=6549 RepID=UPI002246C843|nr:complement C1q-like protein 3 [Mytilus californianus]
MGFNKTESNNQKRLLDATDILHQVQVDVQNLKANMATVQSQVKTSQTPRIGFTSTISKDVVNLGDNQVIRFDTVYTNEGGDYNHLTGIFTCEIPGLYAFYVHTLAEPGKHLETEITKNLRTMANTYAYDKEAFSSGSNMAVMILQKGDTVLVRSHGSAHSHNGSVIDYWYTSFSGFLIAP